VFVFVQFYFYTFAIYIRLSVGAQIQRIG